MSGHMNMCGVYVCVCVWLVSSLSSLIKSVKQTIQVSSNAFYLLSISVFSSVSVFSRHCSTTGKMDRQTDVY